MLTSGGQETPLRPHWTSHCVPCGIQLRHTRGVDAQLVLAPCSHAFTHIYSSIAALNLPVFKQVKTHSEINKDDAGFGLRSFVNFAILCSTDDDCHQLERLKTI